jgi:hypothetical protein
MNLIRKFLGIIWMLGGVVSVVYFPLKAIMILGSPTVTSEDYVFWVVILLIFIPVIVAFILFGYYAIAGEYNDKKASNNSAF